MSIFQRALDKEIYLFSRMSQGVPKNANFRSFLHSFSHIEANTTKISSYRYYAYLYLLVRKFCFSESNILFISLFGKFPYLVLSTAEPVASFHINLSLLISVLQMPYMKSSTNTAVYNAWITRIFQPVLENLKNTRVGILSGTEFLVSL